MKTAIALLGCGLSVFVLSGDAWGDDWSKCQGKHGETEYRYGPCPADQPEVGKVDLGPVVPSQTVQHSRGQDQRASGERMTLNFTNTSLGTVVGTIAMVCGWKVSIDPRIGQMPLAIRVENEPCNEIFESIVDKYGLGVEVREGVVLVY